MAFNCYFCLVSFYFFSMNCQDKDADNHDNNWQRCNKYNFCQQRILKAKRTRQRIQVMASLATIYRKKVQIFDLEPIWIELKSGQISFLISFLALRYLIKEKCVFKKTKN